MRGGTKRVKEQQINISLILILTFKSIQTYNLRQLLLLHGFFRLIKEATSISAGKKYRSFFFCYLMLILSVVVLASDVLVSILGTILKAPLHNNDSHEQRAQLWAASTLHALLPSLNHLQGIHREESRLF